MIIAIVLMGLLLSLRRWIVGVMDTPAEAIGGMNRYLTVCFIGIPFIIAYNIIASIFRGLGDSRSPMYFVAVACAFNIVLDWFFTACGYSIISFVHNSISIVTTRIPLAWLSSRLYPDTLYPMGLSTCTGSIVSCVICIGAFLWMRRNKRRI